MTFDYFNFPVISSTSGEDQDGVILGNITSSSYTAAFFAERLCPIELVLREDKTTTGSSWLDVTSAATSATPADFAPFGILADMSDEDAFYYHTTGDKSCNKIDVQISTVGVGTWTMAIQEWDRTNEVWSDMVMVDGSNGLRAGVGIYTIAFTHTKTGNNSLKLQSTDEARHVWHRIVVRDITEKTVAPVLSRLWVYGDTDGYTDVTVPLATGDWTGIPAEFLPLVGSSYIRVHPGVPLGEDVTVTSVASTNYTAVREYLANDNTWKPMTGLSDTSVNFTVIGTHKIRWTRPIDWLSKTITINSVAYTGHFERTRISVVDVAGPVATGQWQASSWSLGGTSAKGVIMGKAVTYSYATMNAGANNATSDIVLSLINAETGDISSFIVPETVDDSYQVAGGRLNLSVPISFAVGQTMLMTCVSGGPLLDAHVRLH
jgi:hypothetical protein